MTNQTSALPQYAPVTEFSTFTFALSASALCILALGLMIKGMSHLPELSGFLFVAVSSPFLLATLFKESAWYPVHIGNCFSHLITEILDTRRKFESERMACDLLYHSIAVSFYCCGRHGQENWLLIDVDWHQH
jgi:hypothetical protein